MPGKRVANRTYIHVSLLADLSDRENNCVRKAIQISSLTADEHFHVVRFDAEHEEVALLSYPTFFTELFPCLHASWRIHLPTGSVRLRDYSSSVNPPILHRKELMLAAAHVAQEPLRAVTQLAESIGLFEDPVRIGFRSQWNQLLASKGYAVIGQDLIAVGNLVEPSASDCIANSPTDGLVLRHLTALSRSFLSAPVQALLRHGLLKPGRTFFDYGCGKGDDLASVSSLGIDAQGWDPHFRPQCPRTPAAVVNIGFVINVIDAVGERIEALKSAYALTQGVLSVSAMLWSSTNAKGTLFGDGYLTSRNTFQKYFSQSELQSFIENVLDEQAVPVGPGIFFVFKDRFLEQQFLSARQCDATRAPRLLSRTPRSPTAIRPKATRFPSRELAPEQRLAAARLWHRTLELGRPPTPDEYPHAAEALELFGSWSRALRSSLRDADPLLLKQAAEARAGDVQALFALQAFSRRQPFRALEATLQRDVKAHFGSLAIAEDEGRRLLRQCADVQIIRSACNRAAESGLGWLDGDHSLQLHTSLVNRLEPVLRVYVGCATALYGDVQYADLVKIHIQSGKVTLMKFDDFSERPLPRMMERVKVKLREQDFDRFQYGGQHEPPYLYFKSRYMNEEFAGYPEQLQFDRDLEALELPMRDGFGPLPEEFAAWLQARRLEVCGMRIMASSTIPALDEPCGKNFSYRQLCECGETWHRMRPINVPQLADSYNALYSLATSVLDPVIEYFGGIELTYGFSSPALTKLIKGRIAPELDQHAACERDRMGQPVCRRGGAAVDFIVRDEDMREVARWIAENCQFSRLYLYGTNRPIHISIDERNAGEVFEMNKHGTRRVPKRIHF